MSDTMASMAGCPFFKEEAFDGRAAQSRPDVKEGMTRRPRASSAAMTPS